MGKKIAIAGMGIAGSFLLRLLLQKGYDADDIYCYDVKRPERCGIASCAFGVAKKEFVEILKSVKLDAEKYILNSFNKIFIDDIVCKADLCTIDKPKLLHDLIGDKEITILDDGERIVTERFDLVVDATGVSRCYLPPINKKEDIVIPTIQYRVKTEEKLPLMMLPGGIGYGWCFGLGNNEYHIGMGCLQCDLEKRFEEVFGDVMKKSKIMCRCSSYVRILTPRYAMPIISGNIVGVGESVGCIVPLNGAGILTSMEAATILSKNLKNLPKYEKELIKKFSYLDVEVNIIKQAIRGEKPRLRDAMGVLQNSKKAGLFMHGRTLLQLLRKECETK